MNTRSRVALLLLLLAIPLLLQAASLPHTHAGAPAGLFNQEHDLTLLATAAAAATPAVTGAVVLLLPVGEALASLAPGPPVGPNARRADSRAPPLR